MTLDKYKFTDTPGTFANPLSKATQDIAAQLYPTAVDLNNKPLLRSCLRGIDSVMDDVISGAEPGPDACPCIRILTGRDVYPIKGVDFITLDGLSVVHLYFIYYGLDTKNFEELRDDHWRRCIRYLQIPSNDPNSNFGLVTEGGVWYWPNGTWNMTVDHDTPLRFFGQSIVTADGYFVTRIDLQIEVNDIPTP